MNATEAMAMTFSGPVTWDGELISFRRACELFFGTETQWPSEKPKGMGTRGLHPNAPSKNGGSETGNRGIVAYVRPSIHPSWGPAIKPLCEADHHWRKIHSNVPTPLPLQNHSNGRQSLLTPRCSVRYSNLQEARSACCAEASCEAVVRDGGMRCNPNRRYDPTSTPMTMHFELRKGLDSFQRMQVYHKTAHIGSGDIPDVAEAVKEVVAVDAEKMAAWQEVGRIVATGATAPAHATMTRAVKAPLPEQKPANNGLAKSLHSRHLKGNGVNQALKRHRHASPVG